MTEGNMTLIQTNQSLFKQVQYNVLPDLLPDIVFSVLYKDVPKYVLLKSHCQKKNPINLYCWYNVHLNHNNFRDAIRVWR
jgi:hypothetical protein